MRTVQKYFHNVAPNARSPKDVSVTFVTCCGHVHLCI